MGSTTRRWQTGADAKVPYIVLLATLALAPRSAGADCTTDDYPNPTSYFEFEDVLTGGGFIDDSIGTHVGVLTGDPQPVVDGVVGGPGTSMEWVTR